MIKIMNNNQWKVLAVVTDYILMANTKHADSIACRFMYVHAVQKRGLQKQHKSLKCLVTVTFGFLLT